MEWLLPPDLPWPKFLRLLRHPAPPRGWLEAASRLEDLRKRPLLLRWIAQHPKAPAHLRATLMGRLPWRALAAVSTDAGAHPQARSLAVDRLQLLWQGLSSGERRALALHAPRQLWPLVWRNKDARVLASFLFNPRLSPEALAALIQPPLSPAQAEALPLGPWKGSSLLAQQALVALDGSFRMPECPLVLGQAAPWIRVLEPEEAVLAASRLRHPPLRRLVRAWADRTDSGELSPDADRP